MGSSATPQAGRAVREKEAKVAPVGCQSQPEQLSPFLTGRPARQNL
jgi:hypothetical protein